MQLSDRESPYLYEEKRPYPVAAMPGRRREKQMKPWQGFLFFVILMILFYAVGLPLVMALGMYGNAVAEAVIFLGGSILIFCAMNIPLKKAFPIKKPDTTGILAVLLLWHFAYRGMSALFMLLGWMFPEQYFELSYSMDDSLSDLSVWAEMLVVAVTPAICEEALHRGLLQYSLRGIRARWLTLLLMGVYFGAFHMSLIRFLPMMFLGIVISHVRMKTDNMVYASLFHFINNAFSVLLPFLAGLLPEYLMEGQSASAVPGISMAMVGSSLLWTAVLPIGLYIGNWLLTYSSHGGAEKLFPEEKRTRTVLLIAIPSALLAAAGILFLAGGMFLE